MVEKKAGGTDVDYRKLTLDQLGDIKEKTILRLQLGPVQTQFVATCAAMSDGRKLSVQGVARTMKITEGEVDELLASVRKLLLVDEYRMKRYADEPGYFINESPLPIRTQDYEAGLKAEALKQQFPSIYARIQKKVTIAKPVEDVNPIPDSSRAEIPKAAALKKRDPFRKIAEIPPEEMQVLRPLMSSLQREFVECAREIGPEQVNLEGIAERMGYDAPLIELLKRQVDKIRKNLRSQPSPER